VQDLSNKNIQSLQPSELTSPCSEEQPSYSLPCTEKTSAEEKIHSSIYTELLVVGDSRDVGV